jgi:diguanylate cyclase (GGDEF)-like protein/PAS domain S-box-containing protein
VAWGACGAVAFSLRALTGNPAWPPSFIILAIGTVVICLTLVLAVRHFAASQSLGITLAEALVTGSSVVTVFWCLSACMLAPGTQVDHQWSAFWLTTQLVIDATIFALVFRLLFSTRSSVADSGTRGLLLVVLVTVAMMTVARAAALLRWLGADVSLSWTLVFVALGYLGAASAPWLRSEGWPQHRIGRPGLRSVPYVFVVVAMLAVLLRGATEGAGPITIFLMSLPVASLVLALALALRENSRLLDEIDSAGRRLTALVENTNDVIARLDVTGSILTVNAAAERLLRRRVDRLIGARIIDLVLPDERNTVRSVVLAVAQGRRAAGQVEMRLAPPASGTAELRLRSVEGGAVANLHDVTDAVRLRDRLERMARFDQMTGLANRTYLLEQVGSWLAENLDVVILYGDLDGFKGVNDRFGHHAGDAVLVEVAERLRAVAKSGPPHSMVSRLGGDEFVIALTQASPRLATSVAERWTQILRSPFSVGGRSVVLGVSVGVARSNEGRPCEPTAHGAAELVHRADLAMFAAKSAGRGRVVPWTEALDEDAQRRVDIAIGLRRALATGHLAVGYQPIVRLHDGVITGVEALVRIPAPALDRLDAGPPGGLDQLARLVTPAELVAVAEEIGLIQEMGRWVLVEAVRQAARLQSEGFDLTVAVNISVGQLAGGDFPETVSATLEQYGLAPDRLMLEITESRVVSDSGPTFAELCRLRDLGVRIAIDDFGTGYSALAYLRRLPVHVLKVDRALLDGVGTDPQATAMLRAIISVARALKLGVVVEGLEDAAMALVVRELGATFGQGFALSPAVDHHELRALLRDVAAGRRHILNILDLDGSHRATSGRLDRHGLADGDSASDLATDGLTVDSA